MRRLMILIAVFSAGFAGVAMAADAAKGKEVFNSAAPKCSGLPHGREELARQGRRCELRGRPQGLGPHAQGADGEEQEDRDDARLHGGEDLRCRPGPNLVAYLATMK